MLQDNLVAPMGSLYAFPHWSWHMGRKKNERKAKRIGKNILKGSIYCYVFS
jgi:hypothetical protein